MSIEEESAAQHELLLERDCGSVINVVRQTESSVLHRLIHKANGAIRHHEVCAATVATTKSPSVLASQCISGPPGIDLPITLVWIGICREDCAATVTHNSPVTTGMSPRKSPRSVRTRSLEGGTTLGFSDENGTAGAVLEVGHCCSTIIAECPQANVCCERPVCGIVVGKNARVENVARSAHTVPGIKIA